MKAFCINTRPSRVRYTLFNVDDVKDRLMVTNASLRWSARSQRGKRRRPLSSINSADVIDQSVLKEVREGSATMKRDGKANRAA